LGRKRTRTWKHFYLCFVCLIAVLFFAGCGGAGYRENLLRSDRLLARGDYEGAIEENRKLLSEYPDRPPSDNALFNMGLIYAHYGNPRKDYKKASGFFWELIKDYPRSSKIEEAKIWIGVLNTIEETRSKLLERIKKEKEIEKEEERPEEKQPVIKSLLRGEKLMIQGDYEKALAENQNLLSKYKDNPPGDDALYNIGLIYAHFKDYKKARNSFKRLLKDFPRSSRVKDAKIWLEVLNVIEETKQIDIEIEEKKKELR
jgi:tetratricopeptide (TPR) repeat protein